MLLGGSLVATLVHSVDGMGEGWRIDLLDEVPASERPTPFTAQSHVFHSYPAALKWLGIVQADVSAGQRLADLGPRIAMSRNVANRSASLSIRDRYRLRLLSKHSRFYADATGLSGLASRGLVALTGRIDKTGRSEWTITDAGRELFALIEP